MSNLGIYTNYVEACQTGNVLACILWVKTHPPESLGKALIIANMCGLCSVVEYILEHTDTYVDTEDGESRTAFIYAVLNQHMECANILFKKGANVNHPMRAAFTVLHAAVLNGDVNMVKYLMDKGADPEFPNEDGYTPIYYAESEGHDHILEIMTSRKGNN